MNTNTDAFVRSCRPKRGHNSVTAVRVLKRAAGVCVHWCSLVSISGFIELFRPRTVLLFPLALGLQGCVRPGFQAGTRASTPTDADHFVQCHNGLVVSVSGPASDVGLAILKQGGN